MPNRIMAMSLIASVTLFTTLNRKTHLTLVSLAFIHNPFATVILLCHYDRNPTPPCSKSLWRV